LEVESVDTDQAPKQSKSKSKSLNKKGNVRPQIERTTTKYEKSFQKKAANPKSSFNINPKSLE